MQEALNGKDQEIEELREATDSAKETIISQNEHIAHQDSSMRQLKKRLQSWEKDHSKKMDGLQRENERLQSKLERCFLGILIMIENLQQVIFTETCQISEKTTSQG